MARGGIVAALAGVSEDALDVVADGSSMSGMTVASVWPSSGLPGRAFACSAKWPPFERLSVVATETLTPNS